MKWFDETLHNDVRQSLLISKVLYQDKTDLQDLIVFENPRMGRVLALDGVIQTTEGDEFIYHEMLTHTPILAHGNAKKVLIIGGGDGGMLREVLKHPGVEPTMVEIDPGVIDLCKTHLPSINKGAFDDPRARILIDDGAKFMAETEDRFDVIIIDSTDPVGPGAILFSAEFYAHCQRAMAEGGVMVTQNGVPFVQGKEVTDSHARLSPLFPDVWFYRAAVPSYAGGDMAFGWASKNPDLRRQSLETLSERYGRAGLETRYYNPEVHLGAFALPNSFRALIS